MKMILVFPLLEGVFDLSDGWFALILDCTPQQRWVCRKPANGGATVPTPNALRKSRLFITVILYQFEQ
jgi:hypothetical protein